MEGWHIPFVDFILCFAIKQVIFFFLVLPEWVVLTSFGSAQADNAFQLRLAAFLSCLGKTFNASLYNYMLT